MASSSAPDSAIDPHPGKTLLKSARALLRQDRSVSLLPLIGGVFSLTGAIPLLIAQLVFNEQSAVQFVLYALTVFIGTTVTTFFGVALAAGAATRMDGGDPTIGSCLSVALGNFWSIIRWAFFATVVGLILRAIESRLKGAAAIMFRFLGSVSFAAASYFVVPMLAHESIGPIAAIKRSASTVTAKWRTTLRFSLRMGLWAFLVMGGAVIVFGGAVLGGIALAVSSGASDAIIALGIAIAVLGSVMFGWSMLYVNAVSMYGRTALYRYATGRSVPGFSTAALQGAARQTDTRGGTPHIPPPVV